MTGLDVEKDHILEIACIITDKTLKIISTELNIIIHQSNIILDNMNAWCKKQHKKVSFYFMRMIYIFLNLTFTN